MAVPFRYQLSVVFVESIFERYATIPCQEKNPDQKILFFHGEIWFSKCGIWAEYLEICQVVTLFRRGLHIWSRPLPIVKTCRNHRFFQGTLYPAMPNVKPGLLDAKNQSSIIISLQEKNVGGKIIFFLQLFFPAKIWLWSLDFWHLEVPVLHSA